MNFTKNLPESYLSVALAKSVLFWVTSVMACMTIATHITQVSGITFKVYVYISLFFMLTMTLLTWFFFQRQYSKVTRHDSGTVSLVVGTGLAGAFISSFFNTGASRISHDLFYYVPNAVYHLQNPELPMDFAIHFIATGGEPFSSYFGATSLPFEYMQAVIAYFLEIHYLTVFFTFSSALLGGLTPVAFFYLVCQFSRPASAAVGALFAAAVILLLGETPRTPGTWSFPYIYTGKVLFISMGLPLFAAASINLLRARSHLDWLLAFSVTTALVGTTSSSMALLPALAAVLVLAYATVSGNYRIFVGNSLIYLSSLSYLLVYTLIVFLNFHSNVSANSPVNEDFPVTFLGHAEFFLEKTGPATPLALIGSTVMALLMTSGNTRKFIVAWIAASIALFLNPIVAPFVIKYLTTPNIYWRMFYIYPLVLLLGLTGAMLFEYSGKFSRQVRAALIVSTIGILVISHVVPFTTSVLYLRTEFGWPRYKMPHAIRRQAAAIIAAAPPPGPMLAPLPLGGVIAMMSSSYPQMRVFDEPERAWFGERGMNAEIEKRICASEFVNGGRPDCLSAFQTVAEHNDLRSVVITQSMAADPQVQRILEDNGYVHHEAVDDLLVYWR